MLCSVVFVANRSICCPLRGIDSYDSVPPGECQLNLWVIYQQPASRVPNI
jgi:hypothetical protein